MLPLSNIIYPTKYSIIYGDIVIYSVPGHLNIEINHQIGKETI